MLQNFSGRVALALIAIGALAGTARAGDAPDTDALAQRLASLRAEVEGLNQIHQRFDSFRKQIRVGSFQLPDAVPPVLR